MKNGFKEVVDKILRKYGLKTNGCVGTVWANGNWSWLTLQAMGYRVEEGIDNPDYDFIILSQGKSSTDNIITALTKIKLGCIIIFRADGLGLRNLMNLAEATKSTLSFYAYGNEKKVLGVLFKGKEL